MNKLNVKMFMAKFSLVDFSCLSALTNPEVYLSWAKLSSSLVNIKICYNMKFILLINVKMPTIAVILTFIIRIKYNI